MRKKKHHKKKDQKQGESQRPISKVFKDALADLALKRTGGSVNLRGIEFQLLYAGYLALTILKDEHVSDKIRLEGIEDIDLYLEDKQEFIQVKTSQNKIDAGTFWELKVLQNFLKVYQLEPNCRFRFVHNSAFTKGMMEELVSRKFSNEGLAFWNSKLNSFKNTEDLRKFLGLISFEKAEETNLQSSVLKSFLENFQVNSGSEIPFLRALFYSIFEWSKNRITISYEDIALLVQSVKDSFSKFPVNPAVQNNWIMPVSYEFNKATSDHGYYDGKAATPSDIARGLPVQRKTWADEIEQSIARFDVIVIKSSSGQGKSTLAWETGLSAQKRSYSIYQINSCTSYNDAVAICNFIESRLIIGELPIIIVDGLSQGTSNWYSVAEIVRAKPVKIIITSREEDWARYGDHLTKITLNVIDIRLSIQEAKEIFLELRKNQRLHHSSKTWEPAWEQIKDKGLLIEFVYLLTKGEMIEERLKQQVNAIGKEPDNAAKIEILRLISLADVLNLRIRTQKLTNRILENYQLHTDRNELYRGLEKEYYLKFGDRYVEGLHPVRSKHLVDILHSHIPIDGSLLELLKILDEDYIYEYFISAPLYFNLNDEFYEEAAKVVAPRAFSEMVYVIDGLMHSEPYNHWLQNKDVYDELFDRGGLELAVHSTVPLQTSSNALENLAERMGPQGSHLKYIANRLKSLTPYSLHNSSVSRFAKHLQKELSKKPIITQFEGISFLYKWFKAISLDFPDIIEVKEAWLMSILTSSEIGESSELFGFYHLHDPVGYKKFIQLNKLEITGWIKKKTNTLTIEEQGEEIYINYLLDKDTNRINENSLYRINIVRSFFPHYLKYCTQAIILPFPDKATIKAALQMSTKSIQPENLGDDFNVHINKIWIKVILDQYDATSVYEWQRDHLKLREKRVDLARKCVRLLEASLEKNMSKANSLVREINVLGEEYLKMDGTTVKYPSPSRRYFDKDPFESEQRAFSELRTPFRNFVNQFNGLVRPSTERDYHLPVVNIKDALRNVNVMQVAYEKIIAFTYKYFPTDEVQDKEIIAFKRLSETAQFYASRFRSRGTDTIVVAERSVSEWVWREEQRLLAQINQIISSCSQFSWQFTPPIKILEDRNLRYATIGIQGFDPANDNELWNFSLGLKDLATTEIDFFNIIVADANKRITHAFRLSNRYFEKMKLGSEGIITEEEWSIPLPLDLNDPTLQLPEGFTKKELRLKEAESFFKVMYEIWKLTEYRNRLNPNVSVESEWLSEIEKEYKANILSEFQKLPEGRPGNGLDRSFIEQFLAGKITLTTDEIIKLMSQKALELQVMSAD